MRIDIVTIFPEMFQAVLGASMLKRAQEQGVLQVVIRDLRAYTHDKRRTVDDRPYGGGPGMVMKPEPLVEAVEAIRSECGHDAAAGRCRVVLMSPQGHTLTNATVQALAQVQHVTLLCGHYEGVDDRVIQLVVDQCVSIGDYILTGGELPAMVLIDCVARFVPGVLGHEDATGDESFAGRGWLEYPQYTRPPVYREQHVPEVLRTGNHQGIARWRKLQSMARTWTLRPDLVRGLPRPSSTVIKE